MGTLHFLDGREDMLKMLDGYVQRAKEGKIKSLAIAAQIDEESIATSWGLMHNQGNLWLLVGAVNELLWRILREGNGAIEVKFTPPTG